MKLGFPLSLGLCLCASVSAPAQMVGAGTRTDAWEIDVGRTLTQYETCRAQMTELVPKLAQATSAIGEAVRKHRNDRTDENWMAMMGVAIEHVGGLRKHVTELTGGHEHLAREMTRALERIEHDASQAGARTAELGKSLEVTRTKAAYLDQQSHQLRKRKADSLSGGPAMSEAEDTALDALVDSFRQVQRQQRKEQRALENHQIDAEMLKSMRAKLVDRRRSLASLAHKSELFGDELDGTAARLDIFLRRKDYLDLCQGVVKLGAVAVDLEKGWHQFSRELEELGLSARHGGSPGAEHAAEEPVLDEDVLVWIRRAKDEAVTSSGGK